MKLVCHGGKCCGIKTIHSLGSRADAVFPPLSKMKRPFRPDSAYDYHNPGKRFYYDSAPKETAKKRLDRYIAYCDQYRPDGIIEIVLSYRPDALQFEHYYVNQMREWAPLLRRRRFRKVTESRNSNSGNTIVVYHRKSGV